MTQDEVAHALKMDAYIMKVGEEMFNGQGETASQRENVHQITRGVRTLVIPTKKVIPLIK